ncbi:phosphoadenylyl-sulfate reductase [Angustibacter sp. McL0619]|uniref:phosphoadenylyl-sulfate reductase n=1 Tax=Angustibacter sp. McL0619 TaxID=3415676 RepID=UPI003CFB8DFA
MTTATDTLRDRVQEAARALDGAPALEIVRWAVEATGGNIAVAGSMQDSVTSHLVSQVRPGVDVLFLDTGYHFRETLRMRDRVQGQLDVNVVDVLPKQTVAEQDAEYGPRLHDRDPGLCCFLRKVAPLAEALAPYDAWVTGLRREESATRANTPVVSWDDKHDMIKVCPLATWTADDVENYQVEHGLLRNALVLQGYSSIGCAPCTRRVDPGADPRSGRWAGTDKVECGIHI